MHASPTRPRPMLAPLLLLAATSLLSACGEFSYKRGANPADLELAKKTCMAKSSKPELLDKCLEQQGWLVHRFDGKNTEDDDSAKNTAAAKTAKETAEETTQETEDPVIEATYSPDNRAPVSKSPSPTSADRIAQANTAGKENDDAAAKATAQKRKTDPLEIVVVNSWWKLGNSAATLTSDVQACVSELGEIHRPDPALQKTTRGLLGCMQKRGWKALRAK